MHHTKRLSQESAHGKFQSQGIRLWVLSEPATAPLPPVARAPETELKPESPMALKERSRVLQDASAPLHFYNNCTILSHNELTQLHTYSAAYCVRFWSAFCTGAGLPGFPLSPMELHFGSAPPAAAWAKAVTPGSPILFPARESPCIWYVRHIKQDCRAWRTRMPSFKA